MRFSVVIPTFNRKDVLRQCLKSLQAQDHPDFEVLVVDGGNDGTDELLAREFPDFRYLRETRSGPSVARNLGIQHATGDIIAFTDDDNVAPPDWLARIADGYARHPEVSGVAGRCEPPEDVWRKNVLARQELWGTWYTYGLTPDRAEFVGGELDVPGATNNVSYRRAVLLQVGGFATTFTRHIAGEERELRERIYAQGYTRFLYVPVKVLHLRSYTWTGFFTQSLETALGVRRHLQRRARDAQPPDPTDRVNRGKIPGLRQAIAARDLKLIAVLIIERVVYSLGRILPERSVLELIAFISNLGSRK
ncbi:MAG: glycosyltransferase family 2 protein [Chloroflexi bacterium]|nr:glycosyltransferase family 2 protein [Chloroflexota bacterium]